MNRVLRVVLMWMCAGAACAAQERPTRPIPEIQRVLIVSVDGLRPDRLLLADTPVMHGLIRSGAFTMWAQTTAVATTLPSHTSMLTGVNPRKHKLEWNEDLPFVTPVYPRVPTLFEMAKKWGYTTAFVTGKSKFTALTKPGTLDHISIPEKDYLRDAPVADNAVKIILEHRPEVMFVHFPAVDKVGHADGWGSAEQIRAIEEADVCIGRLLAALEQAGVRQQTLIIISADHGGAGKTHGPDDPRSRNIPWIAQGPGVKRGYDLTQSLDLMVRTEDTCATACFVLGLGQFPVFDGKPVLLAFENPPKT